MELKQRFLLKRFASIYIFDGDRVELKSGFKLELSEHELAIVQCWSQIGNNVIEEVFAILCKIEEKGTIS